MTRRKRNTLILLAFLLALVGAEIVLNRVRGPEACVQVENLGSEPMRDLIVLLGSSRARVPLVEPGGTARVFVHGRGAQTLVLKFGQAGNPMTDFEVPGFDPGQMNSEGFKLMLRVRPNEVERFFDDAEPTTPMGHSFQGFRKKLWRWLELDE
ncbi:MAG: hypothetical protein NVSMB9_23450 [Isosphaeraceae bacterium]